jgi:hypothetical protein
VFFALFGDGAREFDEFGHFEPDLFFDDFEEGDVGSAEVIGMGDEGPAYCAGASVELADAA